MTEKSSALPDTNKPVDLSPKNLMPKPLGPNMAMKHVAQTLKGADVQIRHNPNAGLRTEQNGAVRMFIEEQRTALYLLSRQGSIAESEYNKRAGDLNRIRDKMLHSMIDWAGNMDPRKGAMGTDLSQEFDAACRGAFRRAKDTSNARVEISAIPTGPVSGQESEEQPIEIPVNLKLSDLDVVEQPLNSGPLNEPSVLEVGLQQPELSVYAPEQMEVKEESGKPTHRVSFSDGSAPIEEEDSDELGNLPDSESLE